MNTLLLDNIRNELAKGVCGVSKYFRENVINTGITFTDVVNVESSDQKLITFDTPYAPGNVNIDDVLFVTYPAGTLHPTTDQQVGRIVTDILPSGYSVGQACLVDKEYPSATSGLIVHVGHFDYTFKILGGYVGKGGYDEVNGVPKIFSSDRTTLFESHPDLTPPVDPELFPVKWIKWLGDPNNLEPGEDLQPNCALCMVEIPEGDLEGEDINEVGLIIGFSNSELNQTVDKIMIGMGTFSTKIKDGTDIFEIYLKVNF